MLLFRARRTLREESATRSRRASSFFPPWLVQVFSGPERFVVPARAAAGLALAAGLAASVPSSSAEPATPAPERSAAATVAADVAAGPILRPPRLRTGQASPTSRAERRSVAAPRNFPAAQRPDAVEQTVVGLPTPLPDVPRVLLPDVTTELLPEPAPALPLPPVPLPPLPLEVPSALP
jgi:hypothetical protein